MLLPSFYQQVDGVVGEDDPDSPGAVRDSTKARARRSEEGSGVLRGRYTASQRLLQATRAGRSESGFNPDRARRNATVVQKGVRIDLFILAGGYRAVGNSAGRPRRPAVSD
jgi:hypothetical protein